MVRKDSSGRAGASRRPGATALRAPDLDSLMRVAVGTVIKGAPDLVLALYAIATLPIAEQDDLMAASMRKLAADALTKLQQS